MTRPFASRFALEAQNTGMQWGWTYIGGDLPGALPWLCMCSLGSLRLKLDGPFEVKSMPLNNSIAGAWSSYRIARTNLVRFCSLVAFCTCLPMSLMSGEKALPSAIIRARVHNAIPKTIEAEISVLRLGLLQLTQDA